MRYHNICLGLGVGKSQLASSSYTKYVISILRPLKSTFVVIFAS